MNNKELITEMQNRKGFFRSGSDHLISKLVLILFLGSVIIFADDIKKPYEFTNGSLLDGNHLAKSFDILYKEVNAINKVIVPVGGIVAWHNTLDPSAPLSIPEGFMKCDGSLIDDPGSQYYGKNIHVPDLNSKPNNWNEGGVFLRGATSSGGTQNDTFQGHRHNRNILGEPEHDMSGKTGGNWSMPGNLNTHPMNVLTTGDPIDGAPAYGISRVSAETRPVSFKVIWLIRIK